jgi:hypothetical protein
MKHNTNTFDAFKNLIVNDVSPREDYVNTTDIIDLDNGSMIIRRHNINKYLERYMCKNEEDLKNSMWYNYGVFVKVIE